MSAITVTEPWATMAPSEVLSEPFVQDFEQAAVERAKRILDVAAAAAKKS